MLEKQKTHMFRGNSGLNIFLWFWNLFYMGLEFYIALSENSGFALAFGLGFAVLWAVTDWLRRQDNRRYDERYRLRQEALAMVERVKTYK